MNSYYVPEIDLRIIRNNPEIVDKLRKKFKHESKKETIIIATDGFYKIDKESLHKYKIIHKESTIKENFYKHFTLVGCDVYHKKYDDIYQVPFEHDTVEIETEKFYIPDSKNVLVMERKKNRLFDLYFISTKKVDENCPFFLKDVSLFLDHLNI